jgi:hypothetical protein
MYRWCHPTPARIRECQRTCSTSRTNTSSPPAAAPTAATTRGPSCSPTPPWTGLKGGAVAQHTQAYETKVDVQRGFLIGISHESSKTHRTTSFTRLRLQSRNHRSHPCPRGRNRVPIRKLRKTQAKSPPKPPIRPSHSIQKPCTLPINNYLRFSILESETNQSIATPIASDSHARYQAKCNLWKNFAQISTEGT